jgi:hypothetical protein
MLLRVSYSCVFLGVLGGGLALSSCSSDNPNTGTGAAGTPPNTAGSTAASGNGSGGSATQGGNAAAGTSTTVAGSSAGGMSGGNTAGGASGGTAGGASPGGASGSGGGGGGGGLPKMSAGCGKDNQDDPTAWKAHDITVTVDAMFTDNAYKARRYWTRPPMGYEKNTPMPLTMWGQGCGQGGGAENVPTNQSGAAMAAVQVQFLAPQIGNKCYSAGPDGDNAKSPELAYFDAALAETLANFCIDTSKIFMGGYSSGGWLTSLISCNRADKVRGVGWVAAGLQKNHDACAGRVPAIIVRGTEDGGTPLDQTTAARDSLIMRNGCTMDTKPWLPGEATFTSSSCLEYQGCMPGYPVVWCPVPGQHTNGLDIGLSSKGFWKFWSTLP